MNFKVPGPMSKKQKIILLIVIALALFMLIIGNRIFTANKAAEKAAAEAALKVGNQKEYTYLDASGNFHTYNLDQDAYKTDINTKKFKLGKESVDELYGDILIADLKGMVLSDAKAQSYPQSKGMPGTHMGLLDSGELTYSDSNYTSKRGIDVSYHQGDIDWIKVKNSGVEFVYIRMGYRGYTDKGTLAKDEKFDEYLKGAKKAGLDVGIYFFSQATTIKEAKEEADFVLDTLGKTELDLPIVYDPENVGGVDARTDGVSGYQWTKNTLAFCKKIKAAKHDTAVYSNMIWEANRLDMAEIAEAGIPVWYADYEPLPQSPYKYFCWQYSSTGTVDGIDGNVDLDIMFLPKSK
ncbi:MAG: glycoside hydrolase family 25 protein [Lachnospiraceae bacterium]|nr:glycoside hydrolase family 25 protein [Lachnospiraceae bacterium]